MRFLSAMLCAVLFCTNLPLEALAENVKNVSGESVGAVFSEQLEETDTAGEDSSAVIAGIELPIEEEDDGEDAGQIRNVKTGSTTYAYVYLPTEYYHSYIGTKTVNYTYPEGTETLSFCCSAYRNGYWNIDIELCDKSPYTDSYRGWRHKDDIDFEDDLQWISALGVGLFSREFIFDANDLDYRIRVNVSTEYGDLDYTLYWDCEGNDTTPPIMNSLTASPSGWTNASVTLTAGATDAIGVTGYYFSQSSTKPSANASGWQSGNTYTVANTYTGEQTWYCWAKDEAGNVSDARSVKTYIDTSVPSISSVTASPASDWTNAVSLTVTATDDVGVTGYRIGDGAWQTSNQFSVTANGTYQIYAKDAAGNVSAGYSVTVSNLDTLKPSVSLAADPTGPTNDVVWLTASSTDQEATDTSGKSGTRGCYYFSPSSTPPSVPTSVTEEDGVNCWGESESIALSGNGTWYCWTVDQAGNLSDSASITVSNIDKTLPVMKELKADKGTDQYVNTEITLTASAEDTGGAGIAGYYFSTSSTAPGTGTSGWQTGTTKKVTASGTYYCWVKDKAGNVSAESKSITVYYDALKPTVTASYSTTNWTNGNVTITATGTDTGGSGVSQYYFSTSATSQTGGSWSTTNTKTVSANGTWYIWVKDKAGNICQTPATAKVANIDTEKPTATLSYDPTTQTNKTVTITVTAADTGGSGVASSGYYWTQTSGSSPTGGSWTNAKTKTVDSNATWYIYVKDNAGNISQMYTATVGNIDKETPNITGVSQNSNTWTTGNITLTVTATDNVKVTEYKIGNGSWQTSNQFTVVANGTYELYAKDAAGNVSSAYSVTVSHIDRTAPTLTLSADPKVWTNQPITLTASAKDDQSGVAKYYFSTSGTAPKADASGWQDSPTYSGLKATGTWYCWAKDKVNNISERAEIKIYYDAVAPTIKSFTADPSTWTNTDVVLTVSAGDEGGSKLHELPYSYDGGTWTSSTTYTAKTNGEHTVTVRDNAGNTSTAKVTAYIDRTDPTIDSLSATETPTNETQTVTLTASDEGGSKLKDYRVDKGDWKTLSGKTTTFSLSENGAHTVEVRDHAGNITKGTVTIKNIYAAAVSADLSYSDSDPLTVGDSAEPVLSIDWSCDKPKGYKSLQYSIDNKEVASINAQTGVLTALKCGTVTVTATIKNYSASAGTITAEYTVTLHDVPPKITVHPKKATSIAGEETVFDVEATGLNLTFKWYYAQSNKKTDVGTEITGDETDFEIKSEANSSSLILPSTHMKWNGVYFYCVAENTGGKAESTRAKLTVSIDDEDTVWELTLADQIEKNYFELDLSDMLEGVTFASAELYEDEENTETVEIVDIAEIDENYGIYGTENANSRLGFALVTDVLEDDGTYKEISLHEDISLKKAGNITGIKLYNAAACTVREDRRFQLNLNSKSGGEAIFYLNVKGFEEKMLDLTIPLSAEIELKPGLKREVQTADLTVTNNNAFPMTVGLKSVTEQTKAVDVSLPLVSKKKAFTDTDELMDAGVKLGVQWKERSGMKKLYYEPQSDSQEKADVLQIAALTPESSKKFQYFMEYAPLHLESGGLSFAYDILYDVRIPNEDLQEGE